MNLENSFNAITSLEFDGTNYQVWAVKMEAYLDANNLWEAVEEVYKVHRLTDDTTLAEMITHKERKQRKSKAK